MKLSVTLYESTHTIQQIIAIRTAIFYDDLTFNLANDHCRLSSLITSQKIMPCNFFLFQKVLQTISW